MKGLFVFPTLPSLNLETRVRIGFTPSPEFLKSLSPSKEMQIDLKIFQEGQLLADLPKIKTLHARESFEISSSFLNPYTGVEKPSIVQAICSVSSTEAGSYFSQEHQISYIHPQTKAAAYLLYDHLPMQQPGRMPSPIVLLAPKIWVSKRVNTYVVFANASNVFTEPKAMPPLSIAALDLSGNVIKTKSFNLLYNDVLIVDVKEFIGTDYPITDQPQLINMVGKGGQSTFAIYSIIESRDPYSIAIEHSLAPSYFTSGNLATIRKTALNNYVGGMQ